MSTTPTAPDKNSPFEEVRDNDVVRDVYNTCYKQGIPITFWVKDKVIQFEGTVSGYNKERIYVDLPRSVDTGMWDDFFKALTDSKEHLLYGSVLIQKTKFFLRLLVAEREDRTLKFYPASSVFKLQRRTALRLKLSFVNKVYCTFNDPLKPSAVVKMRMMDVSTGGLSFQCTAAEGPQYTLGLKLINVEFPLLTGLVKCNAIVRHTMEARDESRAPIIKVGIQLEGLSPEGVQLLAAFEEQESKHLFTSL